MARRKGGSIRVGVGGWTFPPWRGTFYPSGLAHKSELEFASRKLTSLEINGTYYSLQSPKTFAKWHDQTPDGFVFAVKGSRYITNRRVLAEAGEAIERFFASGILELKDKLGPINWQLMPTKVFDPADIVAFLDLLPKRLEGRPIQHAIEVRHDSFRSREFVALMRRHGCAIVIAADSEYPQIADVTAPFVYVRIMGSSKAHATGYDDGALGIWAKRADEWAVGRQPAGLERVEAKKPAAEPRDVYIYFIGGEKARNPAAAMALIERL